MSINEETLGRFRPHMDKCRTPGAYDKVHNDECVYSFDTPFSAGGIYVSLLNWQGVSDKFLKAHAEKTGSRVYVHIKKQRVLKPEAEQNDASNSSAAASDEGTMNDLLQASLPENKYDIIDDLRLVVLPDLHSQCAMPFPHDDVPMAIADAAAAVVAHTGARDVEAVNTNVMDEVVPVSKYADALPVLDNGKKISPDPSTWVCEESGMKENLWLNLSTGHIGSGRRQWDGSGGTNGALNHFEASGKQYPLVVKLGTINPNNPDSADVYSYAPDEDGMVRDPKLGEHLLRWGINMSSLTKTDSTMAELEYQLNKNFNFDAITEAGAKLVPVAGPGLTGLVNLGNSCYMNSTLQMLLSPGSASPLALKFGSPEAAAALVASAPAADPGGDLVTQLAKLSRGMLSGDYAVLKEDANAAPEKTGGGAAPPPSLDDGALVRPQMFKTVVGRGHAEFSSGRQQDAPEYLQHLLEVVLRAERSAPDRVREAAAAAAAAPLPAFFTFGIRERLECAATKAVRYMSATDNVLALNIPLEAAVNKAEVEEAQAKKRKRSEAEKKSEAEGAGNKEKDQQQQDATAAPLPVVTLDSCLEAWAAAETMQGFQTPAGATADKAARISSFPPFLVVKANRYTVDETWQPKKLEVLLQVPDTIDLTTLRAPPGVSPDSPLREGEVAMPEDAAADAAAGAGAVGSGTPEVDEGVVAQLVSMGLSENGCRRAAIATQNNVEAAMEWYFAHSEDPDFNDPPAAASGGAGGGGGGGADPEAMGMLTAMGFKEEHVVAVLAHCSNDAERAADWLFSHGDDLDGHVAALSAEGGGGAGGAGSGGGAAAAGFDLMDGPGTYKLRAFVSHIGKNTGAGHYVCHALKTVPGQTSEKWVIFNDSNVALSENPPREHAYMYLFEQT